MWNKIPLSICYVTAWTYGLLLHSFDSVQNNAKDWKSNCTKNLHALQIVASVNVLGPEPHITTIRKPLGHFRKYIEENTNRHSLILLASTWDRDCESASRIILTSLYLSVLDFWNLYFTKLIFELDFLPISNLISNSCVACKNQVQQGQAKLF